MNIVSLKPIGGIASNNTSFTQAQLEAKKKADELAAQQAALNSKQSNKVPTEKKWSVPFK
jgi:hypothetical protein